MLQLHVEYIERETCYLRQLSYFATLISVLFWARIPIASTSKGELV